jgi:hypothetical protein
LSTTSDKRGEKQNKNTYYRFICKCMNNEEFITFNDFLDHIKTYHEIKNLNLQTLKEIIPEFNNKKLQVKFY